MTAQSRAGDETTRERIIDAAQQLFAAHGYAATATAKIAAAAGMPGGLVFYYFPTKLDLLLATVRERAYDGSVTGIGEATVAEVLEHAAKELAGVFARNRDSQLIVFREAGTRPEVREAALQLITSSSGDVANLLGAASDAPGAQDCATIAHLLVAGLLLDNFLGTGAAEPTDAARVLAGAR